MHCFRIAAAPTLQFMKRHPIPSSRTFSGLCGLLILIAAPGCLADEPTPADVSAFTAYIGVVESRLDRQHRSQNFFLAAVAWGPQTETRLRQGDLIVERLTPATGTDLPGALLHHWRATAFAPGATAADFDRLMRDFSDWPQTFSPQVVQAKLIAQNDGRLQASMRVRQKHVITVVMDTAYDISFGQLDPQHGYSISRSTHISEIAAPGTASERALNSSEEHGFLWRQNTYWSYEQRDGGLYLQIESVSLTRSIPTGLGWAVRPFVDSVPRESLEFTLRSVTNAIRK